MARQRRAFDLYFKRSYSHPRIPTALTSKVVPLGLSYPLYPDSFDDLESERVRAFARCSSPSNAPQSREMPLFRPTPANMYSPPVEGLPPKVLFVTRTWDPFDHPDRSEEKARQRIRLNETRARCLEALRREFGGDFFGGFERTDYAVRNYTELLLHDDEVSQKENYVKMLGVYPICVSTEGLHRSIGWKMGEYVAFSKAIVSERLSYEIPGEFQEGQNFLGFDTAEECVDAARKLFSDASLRVQMMDNNDKYYQKYVEPSRAIRRTLDIGISGREEGCS